MAVIAKLVEELLVFPDTSPYRKWTGTHWRLVEIADSELPVDKARLDAGVAAELAWLLPGLEASRVPRISGRVRRHGSIEGNAVYALARLGYAEHPGTRQLVEALLDWQWPDGGWNCDLRPAAHRSSFHESAVPALGLAAYALATGDARARDSAERAAELLLRHELFRSTSTGEPIHPSWTKLHYPPYWHYDILQGLRVVGAVGRLADSRASDALEIVEGAYRGDGRFTSHRWSTSGQPSAIDWGRGSDNVMMNRIAASVLAAR